MAFNVMVKEELCEKVVEVRLRSDGMMAVVLVFDEDVLMLIYWYAPFGARSFEEK